MPDVMYLRKSRADFEAEAQGETEILARHEAELMRTAKRLGLMVTEIYREIVSGESITARPVMQQLLAEVSDGKWNSVLVMELERLARGDTVDQGIVLRTFQYSGTKIVTPNKTYDLMSEFDEEYVEFGLFMSRREYKTIVRRQQRGRLASVREGKYVGNKPPYGYTRVKLQDQKGWTLEPDPATSHVVQSIFRWYTEGEGGPPIGVAKIAQRLNSLGVPSAAGQDWTNSIVIGILRNITYAGFVKWGCRRAIKTLENGAVKVSRPRSADYEIARGLHEPLVSKDVYDAAQAKLASNPSRPGPKQVSLKNPLSGLIICGSCGRNMVRRPYAKSKTPDGLICPYTSCNTVGSQLSVVEDELLYALRQCYSELLLGKNHVVPDHDDTYNKFAASLEDEIAATKKQLTRAYELVERGVYTDEVFLARSKDLSDKLSDLNDRLDALRKEQQNSKESQAQRAEMAPRLKYVLDVYTQASPQGKNDLLKGILKKVVYNKTNRERWTGGSDMSLTLYPLYAAPH